MAAAAMTLRALETALRPASFPGVIFIVLLGVLMVSMRKALGRMRGASQGQTEIVPRMR